MPVNSSSRERASVTLHCRASLGFLPNSGLVSSGDGGRYHTVNWDSTGQGGRDAEIIKEQL